jgi:hypothetical protein
VEEGGGDMVVWLRWKDREFWWKSGRIGRCSFPWGTEAQCEREIVERHRKQNPPCSAGTQNYLFAGAHRGSQRTAMFYTFFANCQLNGVNPYKWLSKVLEVIADYPCNKLQNLFPGTLDV